ncbi:hypothetical protein Y032_0092g2559 [Ancylostoma ceylanicum]|uniref:Uncharacterized protein n=1 Tax=Ancylostoma ceylanicum TaxID=53326 RepID=A0A016TM00_9BILA|nr:hypothetical protein Y032_0092g2559 [Ancylostoma ceylanicum]
MWRRLIHSKFPEFVCRTVIQKENEAGNAFDVNDIITAIATTLRYKRPLDSLPKPSSTWDKPGTPLRDKAQGWTNVLRKNVSSAHAYVGKHIQHSTVRNSALPNLVVRKLEDKEHVGNAPTETTILETAEILDPVQNAMMLIIRYFVR